MTPSIRRRLASSLGLVALVGVLTAGCGGLPTSEPLVFPTPTVGATNPPAPARPAPAAAAVPLAESQQSTSEEVPGYRVTIPKLGESSTLIALGLNPDRSIQVPPLRNPMQAGVYTRGPMPGEVGPAVVLAHVNANGRPGFGAGFHTLLPGDPIEVATPTGLVVYRVSRTGTVPKSEFPTSQVYSDTAGPELRLITCGGTFDRSGHNYTGQTIVWAARA